MTKETDKYLKDTYSYKKNGWIYLHIEGDPYTRGFQHGYTLGKNILDTLKTIEYMSLMETGKPFSFFVEAAKNLFTPTIDDEFLEEIKGISDGAKAAGYDISVDKLVAWNAHAELLFYWWPYGNHEEETCSEVAKNHFEHCSAFIATGSATFNNEIIMGHNTWGDFYREQYCNVILDIVPSEGNRIFMQSYPGYIHSYTDFFITGSGIIGCETTILGFYNYTKNGGIPAFARVRKAMQYGSSFEDWVKILENSNTGGVANSWLLGNINNNEIARFELGLNYSDFKKIKDGYFVGFNAPESPQIRNLECSNTGYNDIRTSGARRVRWNTLMNKYYGRINLDIGKSMLADHYNVYSKKINFPDASTICGHYDCDPATFTGLNAPDPYYPSGCVDGKVVSSTLARNFNFWGKFGRSCDIPFNANQFFKLHPQWDWQQGYLIDRPTQPWTCLTPSK